MHSYSFMLPLHLLEPLFQCIAKPMGKPSFLLCEGTKSTTLELPWKKGMHLDNIRHRHLLMLAKGMRQMYMKVQALEMQEIRLNNSWHYALLINSSARSCNSLTRWTNFLYLRLSLLKGVSSILKSSGSTWLPIDAQDVFSFLR